MSAQAISGGVPIAGTPFAFRLLFLLFPALFPASGLAAPCPSERIDERVQVIYVYDGDTVRLTDGRKLRFIGINTPEMDSGQRDSARIAVLARNALQDMLAGNNRTLLLQSGRDNRDHYGRLLAHAFLPGGDNVAVRLLLQGLATTVVIPPNTWGMDCYRQQENTARIERTGLWSLPGYQSVDSNSLIPETRGYRIVNGPVTSIDDNGKSLRIGVGDRLIVHISRNNRINFPHDFADRIRGRSVEVRGWVRPAGTGLRMNALHPAAITLLGKQKTHD